MPSLVYTDESGRRATVDIAGPNRVATIGRNPDCSITTTNPSVSRNHSEIRLHGPYVVIEDKGSSNGTFVNDDEVKKPVVLVSGDLIKCGDFEIEFLEDGAEARGTGSEVPAKTAPPAGPPTTAAAAAGPTAPKPQRPRASRPEPAGRPARAARVESSASIPAIQAMVEDDLSAENAELARKVDELQTLVSYYENEGNTDEFQAKMAKVSTELTRQEAITQTLEEQQEQLQIDLRQQDKLIGELENRLERRDMEIENHLEKQKELREQLAHQSDQIGDLRRDVNDRDHEIEELAYKHEEAQRTVEEIRKSDDEKGQEIQEYKAELSQKSRLVEELQKQLDIMTYDLKAAQEELEDVAETSTRGGAEVTMLERKVRHLQEIVTDKEGIIEGLKSGLEEREQEIGLLREDGGGLDSQETERWERKLDDLQAEIDELQSAGRGGATTDKLNELKRANRELRHRVEELESQPPLKARAGADEETAAGGERDGGGGRQLKVLQADLGELQEENELLRKRVDKLRRGGGEATPNDGAAITALKRENRELRRRIREMEESGGGAGRGAGDEFLVEFLDDVNSAVSTWVSDFDSATFSAAELKRLVEMLDRVDLSGLEARDRRKLESIIRDVEPHETLGNLEDTLNVCLERAKDMKAKLREARRRMIE